MAVVGSGGIRDGKTPQRTFKHRCRRRIWASSSRIDGGVAFDVNVECGTASSSIASLLASDGVVALQA